MVKEKYCLKYFISFLIIFFSVINFAFSQSNLSKTMLYKLKSGDSLTYYQCHVEKVKMKVESADYNNNSVNKTISITEKFIIHKKGDDYLVRYWKSDLYLFPNRKFSGLKIREKKYWNFSFSNNKKLNKTEIDFLAALELKGKEANEYDYAITKHTLNQIIIKQSKNFIQLILDTSIVISPLLKLN